MTVVAGVPTIWLDLPGLCGREQARESSWSNRCVWLVSGDSVAHEGIKKNTTASTSSRPGDDGVESRWTMDRTSARRRPRATRAWKVYARAKAGQPLPLVEAPDHGRRRQRGRDRWRGRPADWRSGRALDGAAGAATSRPATTSSTTARWIPATWRRSTEAGIHPDLRISAKDMIRVRRRVGLDGCVEIEGA